MAETLTRLLEHVSQFPALGQFFAILLVVGLGEEFAALTVFALARHGSVPWWIALSGAYAGAWLSHFLIWGIGVIVGHRALAWPMFRRLESTGQLSTIRHHMTREGWIAVAVARFVPGIRVAVYLIAGILDMKPIVFLTTLSVVCFFWVLATLGLVQLVTDALTGRPMALVIGIAVAIPAIWALRRWLRLRRARHPAPAWRGPGQES